MGYDNLGNLLNLTFGKGVVQTYGYDPDSRLQTLTTDLAGTTTDLTIGGSTTPITYNAVSQICFGYTRLRDLDTRMQQLKAGC
jgi:YD repeat-containing protein